MSPQELIILSFFDSKIPKLLKENDLTTEMHISGIGTNSASKYQYDNLVNQLIGKDFLTRYIDKTNTSKGLMPSHNEVSLILTDKGLKLKQEQEKRNELNRLKENLLPISNYVTNNISGNNNHTNNATGYNVDQSNTFFGIKTEDEERLKSYGITESEINELKSIIHQKDSNKSKFTEKVMTWMGTILTTLATKGITENIPAITHFVSTLIQ